MPDPIVTALDRPVPKTFIAGTHRCAAPDETLARVRPLAARMGITRIGDITGLDRIGIPVAIAVRPNSASVSVAQGKGLSREQAAASALMEAVEGFHGEGLEPRFRLSSWCALSAEAETADPETLSRNGRPFDPDIQIDWIEGYDLLRGVPCWLPAEIVHLDYSAGDRNEAGCFLAGSNGLASGNCLAEAIGAGLYEVIERDAVAIWTARSLRARSGTALDLGSVDDPAALGLLARFAAAGVSVRVWNVTSDVGLAAFMSDIRAADEGAEPHLRRFRGAGCHPDRRIALLRALTEAAQTRLTYISGARDDLAEADYAPSPDAEFAEALLDALLTASTPVRFADIPDFRSDDVAQDVLWTLSRLRTAGIGSAVAVDLTRAEFGVPVVRVVVPGLEGDTRHPEYRLGPRARNAAGPAA